MEEVVDHNLAIEALKKELVTLEAKKARLAGMSWAFMWPELILRTYKGN